MSGVSRSLGVALALVVSAGTASAERPRTGTIEVDPSLQSPAGVLTPTGLAPYNTLFLNRCANGCAVKVGSSNSTTDSWPINSNRTLTAFPYGDAVWAQVMTCVKDVFSPFQINVTDVDPGTANHFEIMVAGSPTDVGLPSAYGGVAPGGGSCTTYTPNALVFDFAKVWASPAAGSCDASCVEEICSTAAQEIGHTWMAMDHVTDNKDPMTYFPYLYRKYFQNTAAACGSDCVNGQSPTGMTCTGTGNQTHGCICGPATQNSYTTIQALFGLGPGSPPTVKITGPKFGASVDPGFSVYIDATDDSGLIDHVDLMIDGTKVSSLPKGPFVFNAPTTLGNGTHHIEAIAFDPHQTPGSAKVDVVIGPPCKSTSDCPMSTDVCVGGRCVPGSGVMGGLGTVCTMQTDCVSGICASDGGSTMYCVEQCMPGQCPGDFGCLDDGTNMGTGYCWPGYDDGTGGCGCESNRPGGPLSLGVLFGVVVLTWRRRRR